LILYGSAHLKDMDVPHRTALTKLIKERFDVDYSEALQHVKSAGTRVSFTSDLWSNLRLLGFMAITAHYSAKDENGHLRLFSRLIAFRSVPTQHTGANLGTIFFGILKEAGLLHRVSD
ncbi:hypothetical protein BXZ70DRAFT_902903, partial [Cristinia sonorae]